MDDNKENLKQLDDFNKFIHYFKQKINEGYLTLNDTAYSLIQPYLQNNKLTFSNFYLSKKLENSEDYKSFKETLPTFLNFKDIMDSTLIYEALKSHYYDEKWEEFSINQGSLKDEYGYDDDESSDDELREWWSDKIQEEWDEYYADNLSDFTFDYLNKMLKSEWNKEELENKNILFMDLYDDYRLLNYDDINKIIDRYLEILKKENI